MCCGNGDRLTASWAVLTGAQSADPGKWVPSSTQKSGTEVDLGFPEGEH